MNSDEETALFIHYYKLVLYIHQFFFLNQIQGFLLVIFPVKMKFWSIVFFQRSVSCVSVSSIKQLHVSSSLSTWFVIWRTHFPWCGQCGCLLIKHAVFMWNMNRSFVVKDVTSSASRWLNWALNWHQLHVKCQKWNICYWLTKHKQTNIWICFLIRLSEGPITCKHTHAHTPARTLRGGF